MKSTDYPIFLIYSEEDQAWLARVDQLPGCVVDGQTPMEALNNAKAAIEAWIETSVSLKRAVPEPLTVQKLEVLQVQNAAKQQEIFQLALQNAIDDVLSRLSKVQLFGVTVQGFSGVRGVPGRTSHLDPGLVRV